MIIFLNNMKVTSSESTKKAPSLDGAFPDILCGVPSMYNSKLLFCTILIYPILTYPIQT